MILCNFFKPGGGRKESEKGLLLCYLPTSSFLPDFSRGHSTEGEATPNESPLFPIT